MDTNENNTGKTREVSPLDTKKLIEDAKKKKLLKDVYAALSAKGYDPIKQLVGYILTGDPTYITTYGNARDIMRSFDRFELIELILSDFYKDNNQ